MKEPSVNPAAMCCPSLSKLQERIFWSNVALDNNSKLFIFHKLYKQNTSILKYFAWVLPKILLHSLCNHGYSKGSDFTYEGPVILHDDMSNVNFFDMTWAKLIIIYFLFFLHLNYAGILKKKTANKLLWTII